MIYLTIGLLLICLGGYLDKNWMIVIGTILLISFAFTHS